MAVPSLLDVTQDWSSLLILMSVTAPLCSFIVCSSVQVSTSLLISQILTIPSPPPLTIIEPHDVMSIDDTPLLCACSTVNFNLRPFGDRA